MEERGREREWRLCGGGERDRERGSLEGEAKGRPGTASSRPCTAGRGVMRMERARAEVEACFFLASARRPLPPERPASLRSTSTMPPPPTPPCNSGASSSGGAAAMSGGASSKAPPPCSPETAPLSTFAPPTPDLAEATHTKPAPTKRVCRICLESEFGAASMLSPCACKGRKMMGERAANPPDPTASSARKPDASLSHLSLPPSPGTQAYVHARCLRRWQVVASKREGDGE